MRCHEAHSQHRTKSRTGHELSLRVEDRLWIRSSNKQNTQVLSFCRIVFHRYNFSHLFHSVSRLCDEKVSLQGLCSSQREMSIDTSVFHERMRFSGKEYRIVRRVTGIFFDDSPFQWYEVGTPRSQNHSTLHLSRKKSIFSFELIV